MKYFPARVKSFQSEKIECYLEFLLVIQYRTEKTSLISDKCGVFKCYSQNTLTAIILVSIYIWGVFQIAKFD